MATILIVDDIPASRHVLVEILSGEGHRLVEASDGLEGLTAIRAERPDLVITDVVMPVMGGNELVRQLRTDPQTSGIPVMFCTGRFGERRSTARALPHGVSYILTKPVEPQEVVSVVDRVLSDQGRTSKAEDELRPQHAGVPEHRARLRTLVGIGVSLAEQHDPNQLLDAAGDAARVLFAAADVSLGIVNPHDHTVVQLISRGATAAWIAPGDALPAFLTPVVTERRTVRIDGTERRSRPQAIPHPTARAFVAAPLASKTRVAGWICLTSDSASAFTDEDAELLTALAGQVSGLYDVMQTLVEHAHRESVLREERDRARRDLELAEVILVALDLDGRITPPVRQGTDPLGWSESQPAAADWVKTSLPGRTRHPRHSRPSVTAAPARGEGQASSDSLLTELLLTSTLESHSTSELAAQAPSDRAQGSTAFWPRIDADEPKPAGELLRTAEERMRFALETAEVGIWDLDCTTGALQWSETLEAHYGLRPGAFGSTFEAFLDRVHPDDQASVRETFAQAMKSGADFSVVNRSIWPDGTLRWLTSAGRILLNDTGEPVRGVGISLDDTHRRALEEQYRQAQKMESVGRLAGGVAHDFNNLVTIILGYCELLLSDLTPNDPRLAHIVEIQKAGARGGGLTRQLLAFSRQQVIEPTLLDLNLIVADMQLMLGRLIAEDITVVLRLCPGSAPIRADRGQIEQVVMNLAVNARDAMPSGGTLTIVTAEIDIDEHYAATHLTVTPGPFVALTVTDTGTGMTLDVEARLFEPFFTTKEPGKGTGLGLAIVYDIVTRGGGTITVGSDLGVGTSFTVAFPRPDVTEIATLDPVPPVVAKVVATQTVLVVDDERALRDLTRRLLQRHGYSVLVASTGDEALRVCEQNAAIDVLLTDVVMPGTTGPELAARLTAVRPQLKVLYMSGYPEGSVSDYGVFAPKSVLLHKPFTFDTLGQKVREALEP